MEQLLIVVGLTSLLQKGGVCNPSALHPGALTSCLETAAYFPIDTKIIILQFSIMNLVPSVKICLLFLIGLCGTIGLRLLTTDGSAIHTDYSARDIPKAKARLVTSSVDVDRSQELLSFAHKLSVASVHDLGEMYAAIKHSEDDQELLKRLIQRWIELDPHHGLSFCNGLIHKDQEFIEQFLEEWADQDPSAALLGASQLKIPPRANFEKRIPGSPAISELSLSSSEIENRWSPLKNLFTKLIEEDQRNIDIFNKLTDRTDQMDAVEGIAKALAEKNPDFAQEWLDDLPDKELSRLGQLQIASALADADPEAASTILEAVPVSYESLTAFSRVAAGLMKKDPREALDWIDRTIPPSALRGDLFQRLESLAIEDPTRVAQALLESDILLNETYLRKTLSQWAQGDYESIFDWLDRHPECPQADLARAAAVKVMAEKDFDTALALAKEEGSARLIASTILGRSNIDPVSAAETLKQQWENMDNMQSDTFRDVVQKWGGLDAEPAMNFITENSEWCSESKYFGDTVSDITHSWIGQSGLEPVEEWFSEIPPSATKEAVAISLSKALVGRDPLAAINYAVHIPDPQMQYSHISNLFHFFPNSNDMKRELIANSNLDDSVKVSLTSRLR